MCSCSGMSERSGLSGSNTDILPVYAIQGVRLSLLCDAGLRGALVQRSDACDEPVVEVCAERPRCTYERSTWPVSARCEVADAVQHTPLARIVHRLSIQPMIQVIADVERMIRRKDVL